MNRIDLIKRKLDRLRDADAKWWVSGAADHFYRLAPPLAEAEIRELCHRYSISLPKDYRAFVKTIGNGGAGPGCGLERFGYVASCKDIPTAKPKGRSRVIVKYPDGSEYGRTDLFDRKGKKVDPFDVGYYSMIGGLAGDGPYGPRAPSKRFPLRAPFRSMNDEMWKLDEDEWSDETKLFAAANRKIAGSLDFAAGTLLLADYGCGITAKLVLNGRFRGQVWSHDPNVGSYVPFGEMANLHYPDSQATKRDREKSFSFIDWYEHWLDHGLKYIKRETASAR